jgi:predicted nucleic acid-binding Zn ribbon protein
MTGPRRRRTVSGGAGRDQGSGGAGDRTPARPDAADGSSTARRRGPDADSPLRLRRPQRLGELLPEAARELGLDAELRLARAIATWDALVAERVPPAAGACRLVRLEPGVLVVAVDEPIVRAELRLRALELLDAFSRAPGGSPARELRLTRSAEGSDPPGRV